MFALLVLPLVRAEGFGTKFCIVHKPATNDREASLAETSRTAADVQKNLLVSAGGH